MEAVAKLKNCPMSARKMRLLVDNIRGKSVNDALNICRFSNREAGEWIEKLLISAISNWEYKSEGRSAEDFDLYIKTALVDEAGMLKRIRPAPHGRAHRVRKRSNHVTLIVENKLPFEAEEDEEIEEPVMEEVETNNDDN
ncbi:50S ribosomal protein L22 [Membranicola marinus]|uniref:Large ribosomal subunit protein uL22 n=1 Tax=Membranihabitans marinus TaxID=1227546 RepID=A0A953HW32_9BACT|nr:50S ribosomal protein L22 [Membranihabitans marinus]MBY5959305.1 50S ribosomal protein L22 [Membranihabitans marinus]